MEVDLHGPPMLPRLPEGADLPEPVTAAHAAARTALDGFLATAATITADTSLSQSGRRDKLSAAAKVANDAMAKHNEPLSLVAKRADEAESTAVRKAVAAFESPRLLAVAQRLASLDRGTRVSRIGAALTSGEMETLAAVVSAPADFGLLSDLNPRIAERLRAALIDSVDPKIRPAVEHVRFGLGRTKAAHEFAAIKISEAERERGRA